LEDAMIYGVITRQGSYADRKDLCEIHINVASFDEMPHKYKQKAFIDLIIGNNCYVAGVHENKHGQVWISSVLYKDGTRNEKIRLIEALEEVGLKWKDQIIIENKEQKYFLKPARA